MRSLQTIKSNPLIFISALSFALAACSDPPQDDQDMGTLIVVDEEMGADMSVEPDMTAPEDMTAEPVDMDEDVDMGVDADMDDDPDMEVDMAPPAMPRTVQTRQVWSDEKIDNLIADPEFTNIYNESTPATWRLLAYNGDSALTSLEFGRKRMADSPDGVHAPILWVPFDGVGVEVIGRYYAKGGPVSFSVWIGMDGDVFDPDERIELYVNHMEETGNMFLFEGLENTSTEDDVRFGGIVWRKFEGTYTKPHVGWCSMSVYSRHQGELFIQSPTIRQVAAQPGALVELAPSAPPMGRANAIKRRALLDRTRVPEALPRSFYTDL